MIYAPVMIPTLNRYDHFKICIESLSKCIWAEYTEVYVALDYPPHKKYVEGYEKIKTYLGQCGDLGFKKLHIVEREHNYGVLRNFKSIQNQLFQKYDRIICTDDDIEFSPNFLQYINLCLERYKDDNDIIAVTGYSYPISWKVSDGATCLRQNVNASDWGIAFWRDKFYEMSDYLQKDGPKKDFKRVIKEHLLYKMIDPAKRDYINYIFRYTRKKKSEDYWHNCWADFVYRSYMMLKGKYTISPVISKTRNYGFDGSGACCDEISGNFGNTALSYNYVKQEIDNSETFEIVEDTLRDYNANLKILSTFDCRTSSEMKYTNNLIWISEHFGYKFAKFYSLVVLPYRFIQIRFRKG